MNTSDFDEIDLAVDVLTSLREALKAQYLRREARIPNNESYDAIETHFPYELKSGRNSIDCLQRELEHWKQASSTEGPACSTTRKQFMRRHALSRSKNRNWRTRIVLVMFQQCPA